VYTQLDGMFELHSAFVRVGGAVLASVGYYHGGQASGDDMVSAFDMMEGVVRRTSILRMKSVPCVSRVSVVHIVTHIALLNTNRKYRDHVIHCDHGLERMIQHRHVLL
jgi:hypothetical protein